MPNRRKPKQFKLLQGTARKDRDKPEFELPALTELPAPPEWLQNVDAVDAWDRFGDELVAHRVITEADLTLLAHLCRMHGHLLELYRSGAEVQASMIAQYRLLASDFGLTPTSRSRVQPAGDPREANPFAQLRQLDDEPASPSSTRRKSRTDTNKGA